MEGEKPETQPCVWAMELLRAKAKQMVLGGAFEAACPGITSLVEITKCLRMFSLQPCVPVLYTFWKFTNNRDIFFIQHNIY